ncbi:MAG TPA: FUSC family protein [Segeticoccus sp.]|nr:FUSC family protein [Segeticoccus sp.]
MTSLGHWRGLGADLGPRAARRSRRSLRERLDRLRHRWFFIVQCAVAAAGAWWIAREVLGHREPFFAPVAAMVCLGFSFGQRLRRVVELSVGVAVGVLIGDVVVHFVGTGVWQIIVVTIAAMVVGALLGAGTLITIQAGIQSVLVVTLVASTGYALSRWLDAVVGGLAALLVATVAPAAPLQRPRAQAAKVARELAAALHETADGLRRCDEADVQQALARARRTDDLLEQLRDLADEGVAVVRLSPFRRRDLPAVQAIAGLLTPLGRAIRNIRVLIGRAATAVWRRELVPRPYTELLDQLADILGEIADELQERRLPVGAREPLVEVGRRSAQVLRNTTLSAEVLRGQVQAIVLELLVLTGLDYGEAREQVPASADLEEALRRHVEATGDPDEE